MTVGIALCSHGDSKWKEIGEEAYVSAAYADPDELYWRHEDDSDNICDVRNRAAEKMGTEWIIFLDADDNLDSNYVKAMKNALESQGNIDAIYRPSLQGFYDNGDITDVTMLGRTDMKKQNCAVIGSMHRRDRFLEVGGFDPTLPILEDWDLWLKLMQSGSCIIDVHEAIYRNHIRSDGRNSQSGMGKYYQRIKRRY